MCVRACASCAHATLCGASSVSTADTAPYCTESPAGEHSTQSGTRYCPGSLEIEWLKAQSNTDQLA
eukprot:6012597-Amphidinium_carterae.1